MSKKEKIVCGDYKTAFKLTPRRLFWIKYFPTFYSKRNLSICNEIKDPLNHCFRRGKQPIIIVCDPEFGSDYRAFKRFLQIKKIERWQSFKIMCFDSFESCKIKFGNFKIFTDRMSLHKYFDGRFFGYIIPKTDITRQRLHPISRKKSDF